MPICSYILDTPSNQLSQNLHAHLTPWKINVEPTNHPFRKENDLPNLHDYVQNVNLQGCNSSKMGLGSDEFPFFREARFFLRVQLLINFGVLGA